MKKIEFYTNDFAISNEVSRSSGERMHRLAIVQVTSADGIDAHHDFPLPLKLVARQQRSGKRLRDELSDHSSDLSEGFQRYWGGSHGRHETPLLGLCEAVMLGRWLPVNEPLAER